MGFFDFLKKDKKESIDTNNYISKEKRMKKKLIIRTLVVFSVTLIAIFVMLFIMEKFYPEYGWIRY